MTVASLLRTTDNVKLSEGVKKNCVKFNPGLKLSHVHAYLVIALETQPMQCKTKETHSECKCVI